MPNQPKTPISNFRLTEHDREQISKIAGHLGGVSMTEAVRHATTQMARLSDALKDVDMTPIQDSQGTMMCPLGLGHTWHVWEWPDSKGDPGTRRYFCVGQPFENGYDPVEDLNHASATITGDRPLVKWREDV